MKRHVADEPAVLLGLPVWFCAAIAFPLHLGWSGVAPVGFAAFLIAAACLLSLGDVWESGLAWLGWNEIAVHFLLRAIGLAVPAALMFFVGVIAQSAERSRGATGPAHSQASSEAAGTA